MAFNLCRAPQLACSSGRHICEAPVALAPSYHARAPTAKHSNASIRSTCPHRLHRDAGIRSVDVAHPYDLEHQPKANVETDLKLRIGIVGFGTFGQFLAKRMVAKGHKVLAYSRSNYEEKARALGVEYYSSMDDFCEEHPEVVILSSSILSTAQVLRSLPLQRLKRNTLMVDVLSVKVFPKQLLLKELPEEFDILCTHPMFGPDSGRGSWAKLNLMYEKVRVLGEERRQRRVDAVLKFFADEGCRMVEMSCEEHDQLAASTQFITHTVGRLLGAMDLKSTAIDTKGFEALLNLVNNTTNDSFELYYGLFLYNKNATDELDRMEKAFDTVKRQLLTRLHDIARNQIFPDHGEHPAPSTCTTTLAGSSSGSSSSSSSTAAPQAASAPSNSHSTASSATSSTTPSGAASKGGNGVHAQASSGAGGSSKAAPAAAK